MTNDERKPFFNLENERSYNWKRGVLLIDFKGKLYRTPLSVLCNSLENIPGPLRFIRVNYDCISFCCEIFSDNPKRIQKVGLIFSNGKFTRRMEKILIGYFKATSLDQQYLLSIKKELQSIRSEWSL